MNDISSSDIDAHVHEAGNDLPTLQSEVIADLQQLVQKSGVLPIRYLLSGVTIGRVQIAGGFANIYPGNFQGEVVCIKENRPDRTTQDQVRKDTLNEAVLCASLCHPNIVPFLGVYFKNTMPLLVYPWMENGDLMSYLVRNPHANRLQLLLDILLGVKYLHERFVVHGDLKGANILVDDSGRALIADFGLASILPSVGGTTMYMAPELFGEGAFNTKETDIFALGCLIFEIFTGKPPFANFRKEVIESKIMYGFRPERPSESNPSWNAWGLTEKIWALIVMCWDANPDQRPTIDVVIQRVEQALSGEM
ncbi:hypothetical protein H0H92_006493 [Tricholoma furcatifolium]|nr:hypothetical protein H0H92_006493 [Tricholoma furcatifolium]